MKGPTQHSEAAINMLCKVWAARRAYGSIRKCSAISISSKGFVHGLGTLPKHDWLGKSILEVEKLGRGMRRALGPYWSGCEAFRRKPGEVISPCDGEIGRDELLASRIYMGSDGAEGAEHRSVYERAWLCLLGSRIVEQGLSNLTALQDAFLPLGRDLA
jgi:hypothetical protein